jgi:hypothetical protein
MRWRIRFLKSFRRWKAGDELVVERGVGDMWVHRRPVAELVEVIEDSPKRVETLVPAVPGLKHAVEAVTGRRRKSAG